MMANKPLKTIKFPGLSDTYTVPQIDNTLEVTGAAADAKKVGDEISDLKSDLNEYLFVDVPIQFTNDGAGLVQYFDGDIQATSATYDHTNYIDVSDYEKISYKRAKSTNPGPFTGMAFYTSSKQYISGEQCAGSQASIGYEENLHTVDVPSNAKYARFSIYHDVTTYGTFYVGGGVSIKEDVEKLENDLNEVAENNSYASRFYGKKISIIGDSIDTFDASGYKIDGYHMFYPKYDVTKVSQTWWYKVITASGASLEVNASWSGSRVTNTSSDPTAPDFYDRVNVIGSPDVIFVTLGTNDAYNNVALGEYDFNTAYTSLSESQFRSAYIKGVKALKALHPSAKIVCITELMSEAYRKSVETIAKALDAEYIDASNYTSYDGVHPGQLGMQQIASIVLSPIDLALRNDLHEYFGKHIAIQMSAETQFINLSGSTADINNPSSSSEGYHYAVVPCQPGDVFEVNAVGGAGARAWGFINTIGTILSVADSLATVNTEITAPANSAYFIVNDRSGQTSYKLNGDTIPERVSTLESAVNNFEGISDEVKEALLACFRHVAFLDEEDDYYGALEEALLGEIPEIKVFLGKGTSGTSIVDNTKRALSEPIPFTNTIPIVMEWSDNNGYVWQPKPLTSQHGVVGSITGVAADSTVYTTCRLSPNTVSGLWTKETGELTLKGNLDGVDVDAVRVQDTDEYFRILFANGDDQTADLPSTPPSGFFFVGNTKYRLVVGNNEDFI